MTDAYTPTFFTRHNRPLRGVMIDNQPWFSAPDLARLLAYRFPHSIHHRFYAHEVQTVRLAYATGSEAAVYKALIRFGHPELEALDRWLTQEVIPSLRDQYAPDGPAPRRVMMSWQQRQMMMLEWQGELWMAWEAMPMFVGT